MLSKITGAKFIISTLVVADGQVVDEKIDTFDFGKVMEQTVLFKIDVEGGGSIVMDLFQRGGQSTRLAQVQNISTITERGSSKLLNQHGVAYMIAYLPREELQYLTFEQVKTLFHEFGHALNIALSQTKYQYVSGARGSTDIIEIPSHFTELYLQDYTFVRQFAQMPIHHKSDWKSVPIKRQIFDKMLFCDRLFEMLEFEESLYFTALDVEFHSQTERVSS